MSATGPLYGRTMPLGGPPNYVRFDESALDDLDGLTLSAAFGADLIDLFASSAWPPEGTTVLRSKTEPVVSYVVAMPVNLRSAQPLLIGLYVEATKDAEGLVIESVEQVDPLK